MEKLWLAALALYLALGAFDPVCAEDTALNLKEIPPTKPKPGQCPRPTGFGTCVERCSTDSDCPKDQKCCSNGCGHVCTAIREIPPIKPKPGQCPLPTGFGTCVERCSTDRDCPKDQKCCSNGCGHVCTAPIKEIPPTKPKPGQCPLPTGLGTCVERCSTDSNCPKDQKCCKNGCGHVCMAPIKVKPGHCPKLRRGSKLSKFCIRDTQCPGNQKCCRHVCSEPNWGRWG